jgi:hypothetical protein
VEWGEAPPPLNTFPLESGFAASPFVARTARNPRPPNDLGHSAISKSFAARIEVKTPERGLFLVVGRGISPRSAVESVGGQVVVQLPGEVRMLAVLRLSETKALRDHPDVALAGPVNVDQARFALFVKLAGLDGQSKVEEKFRQTNPQNAPGVAQEK